MGVIRFFLVPAGLVAAGSAEARAPLSYLHGFGTKAYPVVSLTWGLLAISIAVVVIITVLVVAGAIRRSAGIGDASPAGVPVERRGDGLSWIYIGVGISMVPLVAALIWTVAVLAEINGPSAAPALTIEVTGQQWWWKARYLNPDPSRVFTTANEIHIPVGQPVRIRLIGGDVIHSFWVPALSGKTDTIPGQNNITWIEAERPGTYEGQCTEYCGQQHAHMKLFVIAEGPDDFAAWEDEQLNPAPNPANAQVAAGEKSFEFHCGACHAVRGTMAGGTVAPDLTHVMSRHTIAAGTLPNTIGNLSAWIMNPQSIKPGTRMPDLYLSGPEIQNIRTFLETLQ